MRWVLFAVCFLFGLGGLLLALSWGDFWQDEAYWSPLSTTRLEAKLNEDLNAPPDEAIRLATPLLNRDPRNPFARAVLASAYLQKRDIPKFEIYIFRLLEISEENRDRLTQVLFNISYDREVLASVTRYIEREKPHWGNGFLTQSYAAGYIDLNEFQRLLAIYPNSLRRFHTGLISTEGPQAAYDAFMASPLASAETEGLLLDPDFTQEQYMWPFGWRITSPTVEREALGGVSIAYLGRKDLLLLRQVAKVELGQAYRLEISFSGEASRMKGFFKAEIQCWEGPVIGRADLESNRSVQQTVAVDTDVVGEGCDFVRVRLYGQSGSFPALSRAQINSIQLLHLNQRE